MAYCVFIHRSDSIYEDSPAERYQFPKSYFGRAKECEGDWIVYLEPSKVRRSRGYFAVAKVKKIAVDQNNQDMFVAYIEPNTYLEFPTPVPFKTQVGPIEIGLLNNHGKLSGRAQSAIRPISNSDFTQILNKGLEDAEPILPRDVEKLPAFGFEDEQEPFIFEQPRDRIQLLSSKVMRDQAFRRVVLRAYDERCAFTGLKLINGGGRAEVNAAHIKPVEHNGPDAVNNGIALSGTAHWMFDRGLITVNDESSVRDFINKSGFANLPLDLRQRPHPHFLEWHRQNTFKH
jgi:putative restriction endonuclease